MRSNRFIIAVLVCYFILNILSLPEANALKKYKHTWKIGSVGPDGVGWAVFAKKKLAPKIAEVTNGEVGFIWYWGCIMGDEEDYLAKMRIGQLQGQLGSVDSVIKGCPDMAVLNLPFLFNDYGEVDYIRKHLRDRFDKCLMDNGYKMLIWFEQDFDVIFSTKYEIRTPEDVKKSKFLIYGSEVEEATIKALSGSPIPIPVPEASSAIRAGVFDCAIGPSLWWLGAQLYTITKSILVTPIRYSPGMIYITKRSWDKLSEKHKIAINKELPDLERRFNIDIRDGNAKALKAMINYGVKAVKLNEKELAVFKKRTRPIWDNLAGKAYPKKLLAEIIVLLKEYRNSKK